MPFCRSCGSENATNARFCRGCGGALGAKDPAEVTSTLPRVPDPAGSAVTGPHHRRGATMVLVAVALVVALGAGVGALLLAAAKDSGGEATAAETSRERRPATTAAADPEPPTTTTTQPDQVDSAVVLAQRWATALAIGDWSTARAIEPEKLGAPDSELENGYGGLAASTIVLVTGTPTSATSASLRVGYVAHEDIGTGPRTNVYCNTIEVDLAAGTIRAGSQRKLTAVAHPGFVSPERLEAEVLAGC